MEDEIVTLKKVQERAMRRWKDADSGGFNRDVGSYTDVKEKTQQSRSPFANEIVDEETMEEMLGLSKDARGDEELKRKIRTDGIDEIESVEEDDYDDDTFASGEISPEEEEEEDTTLADLKRDLEESERLHRELASEVEISHKMHKELDSELEELRSLEKEKMEKKKEKKLDDGSESSGSSDSGIEDEDGFLQGEGHSTIDGRSVEFREDEQAERDDDSSTIERLAHEMTDMFEEEKEAEELVRKYRSDEAPEKEEGMSRDINADAEAIKEEARIIREELRAEKELLNKEQEMKVKLDEELLKLKTAQDVEVLLSLIHI